MSLCVESKLKYNQYIKEMYGITEPKPIKKRIFKSVVKVKPHVSVREKLEKKLANSAIKNLINDIFSEESSNASKI